MAVPSAVAFFDKRKEWSRWKHEVHRRYLPKFAGILGSRHGDIFYVDAFAGAGMYEPDEPGGGTEGHARPLPAPRLDAPRRSRR